jgi:glycerophosphoryl diester phosphodiesterase
MTRRVHKKSWLALSYFLIFAFIFLMGFITASVVFLWDNTVGAAAKNRIVGLDAYFLDGFFRRTYHGQSKPRLPDSIPPPGNGQYSWLPEEGLLAIAHGLGPKLFAGANTMATMRRSLEMGFTFFEVDLVLTTDGHLVCYHGDTGEDLDQLSYSQYLDRLRRGKSAPCHFSDLVQVVRHAPHLRVVMDVKNRFSEVYQMARQEIKDRTLGKSFIPQIYFFEQVEMLRRDQFFAGEIFTSYRSALTTGQILDYARRLGIRTVTLTLGRFEEIENRIPRDLFIMIHPVNDPLLAAKIKQLGGRGIYTSYITPQTFPNLVIP